MGECLENQARVKQSGRGLFLEAVIFVLAMTLAVVGFGDEPATGDMSHLLKQLGETGSQAPRPPAPAQKGEAGKIELSLDCLKKLPAKGNPSLKLIDLVGAAKTEGKFVKDLIQSGVDGKVHVGIEDYRGRLIADVLKNQFPKADPKANRLFFYEDGLIPALFDAEENYVSLFRTKRDADAAAKEVPQTDDLKRLAATKQDLFNQTKIRFAHGFRNNDWKYNAWATGWFKEAREKFSPEGKALAATLDDLIVNPRLRDTEVAWTLMVNSLQKEKAWQNADAWMEVTKALATAVGKLGDGEAKARGIASMQPYWDLIADPGSVAKENAFGENIVIGAGAKAAAEKIGKAYCEAASEGKDLSIIANGTYFQPMLEALQTALRGKTATDTYDVVHFRQGGQEFGTRDGGAPAVITPLPGPAPVVDPSFRPPTPGSLNLGALLPSTP